MESGQSSGGLRVVRHQAGKWLILANSSSDIGDGRLGDRGSGGVCTFVGDNSIGNTETRVGTARGASSLENSANIVLVNCLISLENDIVALSIGNLDSISLVGLDGNEVGSDDGNGVLVESNDEGVLSSTARQSVKFKALTNKIHKPVDDTEQMLLAWLDGPAERLSCLAVGALVLAIEESVEGTTRSEVGNSGGLSSSGNGESSFN